MEPGLELLCGGSSCASPTPLAAPALRPWDWGTGALTGGLRAPRVSPTPECQAGEGSAGDCVRPVLAAPHERVRHSAADFLPEVADLPSAAGTRSQTLSFRDVRRRSPELGACPTPSPAAADTTSQDLAGPASASPQGTVTTARCPRWSLFGSHVAVRLQPRPPSLLPSLRLQPQWPLSFSATFVLCPPHRGRACGWLGGTRQESPRGETPKGLGVGRGSRCQHPGPCSRSVEGVCAALLGRQVLCPLLVPLPRPPTRPGSGESSVGKDELWA